MLVFTHQLCLILCEPMDCSTLGPPVPHHLPVCPNSCPLLQWCHPAISSSDAVFSFCSQSFTALVAFPMSWLFTSDDQNTGASASASVLPMSIQVLISFKTDWFDLLAVQGTLRHLLQQHSLKASILCYYLDNNGLIPGLGRYLEEGMATQSSTLAWRIPWTEKPGRLQSKGLQRVGHDWRDIAYSHIKFFFKEIKLIYSPF